MFIVIELQTDEHDQTGNLVYAYSNRAEAESKYHSILSSAATSTLTIHAAVMLDECGNLEKNEFYRHAGVQEQGVSE